MFRGNSLNCEGFKTLDLRQNAENLMEYFIRTSWIILLNQYHLFLKSGKTEANKFKEVAQILSSREKKSQNEKNYFLTPLWLIPFDGNIFLYFVMLLF